MYYLLPCAISSEKESLQNTENTAKNQIWGKYLQHFVLLGYLFKLPFSS